MKGREMSDQPYFPESEEELSRLENKTDRNAVIDQARWAGLSSGMRVLDVGCGPRGSLEWATMAARRVGIDGGGGSPRGAGGRYRPL